MNRIVSILCVVFAVVALGAGEASQPASAPAAPGKILFLGNSITLHGPAPKIGWTGNWGMAASAQDKDYVHLLTAALTSRNGDAPKVMVKNIATFERNYATFDIDKQMEDAFGFGAELVIVAIGENVPKLDSETAKTQFAASFGKLLSGVKKGSPSAKIIVRSCFWPSQAKDQILKQACQDVGGTFVDISGLAKDESNFARSERSFDNKGVANHPGDKGMRAIADAILAGVNSQQSRH